MFINLKNSAEKAKPQQVKLELMERLPAHINAPCTVECQFKVQAYENYYLITLDVDASLSVICQRCLGEFHYHHINQVTLAVCDETMVDKLMINYECVVSQNGEVDLQHLLTDELHLYLPEYHQDLDFCDQSMEEFIQS